MKYLHKPSMKNITISLIRIFYKHSYRSIAYGYIIYIYNNYLRYKNQISACFYRQFIQSVVPMSNDEKIITKEPVPRGKRAESDFALIITPDRRLR